MMDTITRNVAFRNQYNIPVIDAERDGWPIDCYREGESYDAVIAAASADPSIVTGAMHISVTPCAAADKTGAIFWPTKEQHARFKEAWHAWRGMQ